MTRPQSIRLPYGEGFLGGETSLRLRLLEPRWPKALPDGALERRVPEGLLRGFLRGRRRVTVVLPDQTRRCEAPRLLGLLSSLLEGREVTLLAANGLHPPMSGETLRSLYGNEALARWPLVQHDPDDGPSLRDVGTSPFGNRIRLHRLVAEADAVLALSSASLHYFAGFGGGRKMLLPGVAGRESICANHALMVRLGVPGPGRLRGNPLHREMAWTERLFQGRLFHLMVGLDDGYRIAALWGGTGGVPLTRAARWILRHQEVPIVKRYPFAVISCGGHPKDINLIQTHKSLEFVHGGVADGGVILLAASCPQGAGSSEFLPWFRFAAEPGGEHRWEEALLAGYQVNGQTALSWHRKSLSRELWMITDLPQEAATPLGVRRLATLQEGLEEMERRFGRREGLLVPHAASVLPVPPQRS